MNRITRLTFGASVVAVLATVAATPAHSATKRARKANDQATTASFARATQSYVAPRAQAPVMLPQVQAPQGGCCSNPACQKK